jgi:beta-glucosidase
MTILLTREAHVIGKHFPSSLRDRAIAAALCGALVVSALIVLPVPAPAASGATITRPATCPWVAESRHHSKTSLALANEVLSKMTLAEKASFVILVTYPPLQSRNTGVPSLCIPPLSMSDGPNGLANGLLSVTQFPAAIAVAATFNASIARAVGKAVADEARTKGITALQGTELNLARIPQSGRIFETYGEDPYLASVLGVANIEGIQSQAVLDNAKHFSAYTQETARVRLNQIVSARALAELYDAPFRAAVQQAHVASLMCSYGLLNGVNSCSDPALYATLRSWGFTGFVRSDLRAVKNIALAFRAGIALIKPASPATIERLVNSKVLANRDLNGAVRSVLSQMFRFGLFRRRVTFSQHAVATTAGHAALALQTAENSVVLLKNSGSILPLSKTIRSVAVIGTSAALDPVVSGGGSSAVVAPYVITPLTAIRARLGANVHVVYRPGGPIGLELDRLSDVDVVGGVALKPPTSIKAVGEPGKGDLAIVEGVNVTNATATATTPGTGEGWFKWKAVVRARKSGTYEVSLQQIGDTWLYIDGRQILASPGLHARSNMATTVSLRAGQRYNMSAIWFEVRGHPAPQIGIKDVTPEIQAAVAAARRAKVAIVFAGDFNTEGTDRSNLTLPGDANALISAVAAANPHTIVVLNTGGAVYMPWLSHVAAVLEAWYPGQEDGAAIAAVLAGAVDPSGRLPISFPANSATLPVTATSAFPGVNSVVNFSNGLDIGYRWYQANNVAPLFPFGFGLSYTNFGLSNVNVKKVTGGVRVWVTVNNLGARSGTDVVQVYVRYPIVAGEPPDQLRSFARVVLGPSSSRRIDLTIPWNGFQVFQNNSFTTLAGQYGIDIGQSSTDFKLHANVRLP